MATDNRQVFACLLGECEKAITWSNSLADQWLKRNMLSGESNKDAIAENIIRELGDHSVSLAHNRHLSSSKCKEIGLKVFDLESDQKLQDKVLSVHHIYFQTLSVTPTIKIIENQKGVAFILQAQHVLVPNPQMQQLSPTPPNQITDPEPERSS